jgi:hypothetical protein
MTRLTGYALRVVAVVLALTAPAFAQTTSKTEPHAALMTVIVTWLSINFELPAIYEHPQLELVPPAKIAALRYRGLATDRTLQAAAPAEGAVPLDQGRDVVAVYDDAQRIIYLPQGWSAGAPADLSVLVHEMVHHLQNVAGLKYECPQAREKPAYGAQSQWLGLFGRNLADEFEIDGMTLLVRTSCM